jgi:hypothetical protein
MNQIRTISVIVALGFGVIATMWGFYQVFWSSTSSADWNVKGSYSVFVIFSALAVEIVSRALKIGRLTSTAVITGVIAVIFGAIWPLVVVVLFVLASYVVGSAILSILKVDRNNLPVISVFLLGSGAYGSAISLLAHYPVNYPGLYGLALLLPVLIGRRFIVDLLVSLWSCRYQSREFRWLDLAIGVMVLLHFAVALMPEVGHDALAMHLFVPSHLASRHQWGFDVTYYVWAVMPMMGDWIFSIGYMLAGETGSRLVNAGFVFVVAWVLRDLVLWGGGNASGARWAVLIFLVTPLTFTISSSLFIESVWLAFVVAGSLHFFRFLSSEYSQRENFLAAAILLGYGLAAKAVTFTILPVLLLLMVIRYRIWYEYKFFRFFMIGILLFVVVGGIPYVTAWQLTGNPLFPFFNKIFQSPLWLMVNFEAPKIFAKGTTWDIFYQITFNSGKFLEARPGASGFQWILLFVPALIVTILSGKHRASLLFFVAALSVVLAFLSTSYLRYVVPSFVWTAAGMGIALSALRSDPAFVRWMFISVASLVVGLNFIFFNSGTYYGEFKAKPLLSGAGRENYITKQLPVRRAIELVNQLNFSRAPVAVFSAPLTAGLQADALYANWYNYRFQSQLSAAGSIDAVADLLVSNNVDYIILDSNWGSSEKRGIIAGASDKLAEFGAISILKLKAEYLFQDELLLNPDFSSAEGWAGRSHLARGLSDGVHISVDKPLIQIVPITSGKRYKNTVTAMCLDGPAQGRIQVNWVDAKARFISTNIRLFNCTDQPASHTMEVVAPASAVQAVIYATGHTEKTITINKVSFKK